MCNLEMLEGRKLFSAIVKFDPTAGHLSVLGDEATNNLRVTASGPVRALQPSTPTRSGLRSGDSGAERVSGVNVYENDKLIFSSSAVISSSAMRAVSSISLDGAGGADRLEVVNANNQIAISVSGGDGRDQIIAHSNAAHTPQLDGGLGADSIVASYGEGAPLRTVRGGAGDDVIDVTASITLSPNKSAILGDAGDDQIRVTALGKTGFVVMGGEGNDQIIGSQFGDELYGEAGNDFLNHGGGDDIVDGGADFDRAIVGPEGRVVNVEEIVG